MEEAKREIAATEDGWDRRPPDPLIFLVNRMDNMEYRLREEIKTVERGLRQEMKSLEGGLRQEMKNLEGGLRQEMGGLKNEFRELEKTVFDKLEANQKWMMRLFATMGLGFAGIIITLLIKLPR